MTTVLCLLVLAVAGAIPAAAASPPLAPRAAAPIVKPASPYAGQVLILCSTLLIADRNCADATTGRYYNEAQAVQNLGLPFSVLTNDQWDALTAQDFASARAIILGDPGCGSLTAVSAAVSNASVWGPAITGNVIVIGADPMLHFNFGSSSGAKQITDDGIQLATSTPGFPGAYISLSCYYSQALPNTPIPLLNNAFDPLHNSFTVQATDADAVTVVGVNSFLTADTSASLSNWGSTSHEGFDSFPAPFTVFATVLVGGVCACAVPIQQAAAVASQETTPIPTEVPFILLRGSLALPAITPPPTGWIIGDVRDSLTNAVVPGGTLSLTDTQIPSVFSANGGFLFSALSIVSGYNGSSIYGLHLSPPPGYSVVGADTQKVSVVSGHFVWTTFYVSWNPVWVQVLTPNAPLWSGVDSNAVQLGTISQWSYLEVMDPMTGSRLYVYNPVTKGNAYIDRADVGPSGAPPSS